MFVASFFFNWTQLKFISCYRYCYWSFFIPNRLYACICVETIWHFDLDNEMKKKKFFNKHFCVSGFFLSVWQSCQTICINAHCVSWTQLKHFFNTLKTCWDLINSTLWKFTEHWECLEEKKTFVPLKLQNGRVTLLYVSLSDFFTVFLSLFLFYSISVCLSIYQYALYIHCIRNMCISSISFRWNEI